MVSLVLFLFLTVSMALSALESLQIHQQCHDKCQLNQPAVRQCYQRCSHGIQNRLKLHGAVPPSVRKKIMHMAAATRRPEKKQEQQVVMQQAAPIKGRLVKRKLL